MSLSPSQKRRARRNRAAAGVPESEYHAAAAALQGFGGTSGYEGGNQSTRRSWIYWPTLDTKRELSTYSRTEMLKKSRSLRANTGLPNRICGGLADMIGYLQPISMSGDEKWDDLADGHWNDMTSEARVIDASGNFDIKRMQIEMHKAAFGDGDVLPLAIRNSSDGIMLALYDAAQLASPDGQYKDWIDGVKINKFRRHTAYGIKDDEGKVRTYSAQDALYYSFPQQIGQIRPPTVLRHALNHMVDISEILADVKLTIKVAAQMGLYLKHNEMNAGGQLGPMAIQGGLRNEKHPTATGSEVPKKEITVNDIYRAQHQQHAACFNCKTPAVHAPAVGRRKTPIHAKGQRQGKALVGHRAAQQLARHGARRGRALQPRAALKAGGRDRIFKLLLDRHLQPHGRDRKRLRSDWS
jgi:hypothetical protein